MADTFMCYWGKAQPVDESQAVQWHPLAYHSLDVAAVARVLLDEHPGFANLAPILDMPAADFSRLATFLVALHDIGKFAKSFQAKAPRCYPGFLGGVTEAPPDPGHPATGAVWWDQERAAAAKWFSDADIVDPLVLAALGHHGVPVATARDLRVRVQFGAAGLAAAAAYADAAAAFLLGGGLAPVPGRDVPGQSTYAFAGFTVLCDWIGSNQRWFRYEPPDLALADYWESVALPRARLAVTEAGILPVRPSATVTYENLTQRADVSPRPMQVWAQAVDIPNGPSLFVIEDDTGSGKTEAALMLAHRLMTSGHGVGAYVALPTMATANAMFNRLAAAYRSLFDAAGTPSLALAHSARDLNPDFRTSILPAGHREPGYGGGSDGADADDVTASSTCAEWIADDRRRTFFADLGVGTIDQALLAILSSRFQSLRLLGLSQRVLILDEIHAYDAYMQKEIETLLEFQAALGGSVILLSATLPQAMRQHLVAAFQRGLGKHPETVDAATSAYPSACVVAAGGQGLAPVAPRCRRSVPVRLVHTVEDAVAEIAATARAGLAVAYIRNTVDDAIAAARDLGARGLEPMLFHARFALGDRLERERQVIESFGPTGTRKARKGRVLVATQVVEQSLDLDFDLVVSDLAPVDLLIQRAGRLWRHARPLRPPRAVRELVVVSPPPVAAPGGDWFSGLFPAAAWVYRDHARLWLTARALAERGAIDSPDGLRPLIEAVYGPDAELSIPAGLERSWQEAEGRAHGARAIAHLSVLSLADGYAPVGLAWDDDFRVETRLSEYQQVTLRLARRNGERIVPWADAGTESDLRMAWHRSECRVGKNKVQGEIAWPADLAKAVATAKTSWHRYDDDKILVVLEKADNGEHWRGQAVAKDGPCDVFYRALSGLQFEF